MPNIQKIVVSGSAISQLNNDVNYLLTEGDGVISSSAQIATNISGAFGAPSASISTRLTTLENDGPTTAATASYVLSDNVKFASAGGEQTATGVSSSIASRVTTNESNIGLLTAETSSYALKTQITGAFTSTSESIAADIATNVTNIGTLTGATSSYALKTQITGAFTDASASIASDIAALQAGTFDQQLNTTDSVTFAGVTINGNLFVSGSTVTVNSENLNIEDKFILLNSGSAGSPSYEGGIVVESGSTPGTGNAFYYDASDNRWSLKGGLSADNTAAVTADAFMSVAVVATTSSVQSAGTYYKTGNIIVDGQDIYIVTV